MQHATFFKLAKPVMEKLSVNYGIIKGNKPQHAHKRGNLYSVLIATDPTNIGVREIAKHYGIPELNVSNDLKVFREKH